MLGFFNKWEIIKLPNKATTCEEFEEIHKVVLSGIIENNASFFQSYEYGTTSTTYPTKLGYYVVKYVSEAYILHDNTTCNGKISTAEKLVVRCQYIICMKAKTKWYWDQKEHKNSLLLQHSQLYTIVLKLF